VVSEPAQPGAPARPADRPAAPPSASLPSAPEAFGMIVAFSKLYLEVADATALFMSLVCR